MIFMFNKNMFRESAKGRAPSNIVLQILIFLAVFFAVYIAEVITVSIFAVPAMLKALADKGFLSGENSYSFNEIYDIATEVSMRESVLIPTLFCTVFGIILSLIYCLCIAKRSAASMGVRKKGFAVSYLSGILVGAVLMAVIVGISVIFGANKVNAAEEFSIGVILLYFLGFVVQGASEEFIFRGYFMTEMGGKHSPVAAVLISSTAFALAHIANPGLSGVAVVNLILFGVFAALYMILTENIWGVCAIHSMWNFTQGSLWGISVSGTGRTECLLNTVQISSKSWLTGGKFGIEGSIFTTIVLGAASIIVIAMLYKKKSAEAV